MSKGKLIVLEGIDGSGKSLQYRLLSEKLNEAGIDFHKIVFPRYSNESSSLIRTYLSGGFGTKPEDVNAYAASSFFAVDRYASYKEDWGTLYESGCLIISDRYTTSNAVHQGSKLCDNELFDYFKWLNEFEYKKLGIPKPDLVLYLEVDIETSKKRMRKREADTSTKADIHELDEEYLSKCLATAEKAADYFSWKRIPFISDGVEREAAEKNKQIFDIICSFLKE